MRSNRHPVLLLALAFALAFAPSIAWGFADPFQFFNRPHAATVGASAEGLYFTGAPRFASLSCLDCHVGGPQIARLKVGADPQTLFSSGYEPGRTYQIEVELQSETKGLQWNQSPTCTEPPLQGDTFRYVQCNNNNFALEVAGPSGPLAGKTVYCAQPLVNGSCPPPDDAQDESLVAPDGDAIFGNRGHSADPMHPEIVVRNGPTKWHFWWTAPPAGSGALTFYAAVVDGNGGDGTAVTDQDPENDDTVQTAIPVQEQGAPAPNPVSAGCQSAGRAPDRLPVGILIFGIVAIGVRRRVWRVHG